MPIYEYQCEKCGRVTEVLAKSATEDPRPQACGCGQGATFVRLYSTFVSHNASPTEAEFTGCGREGCGGHCAMHAGDQ